MTSPSEETDAVTGQTGECGDRSYQGRSAPPDFQHDLLDNAGDIIFTCDLQGNLTWVNRAAEILTGYTRAELLEQSPGHIVAPSDFGRTRQMLERKLRGEPETTYEIALVTKEGRRIATEVNSRLIMSDGAPVGVQCIVRDVTVRKQLEEKQRQTEKLEAIGQLAGGVAHDFNNLMTVILGYSDIISQKIEGDDQLRSAIEEIHAAGQNAAVLTRQLLAYSRRLLLRPTRLDLNTIVANVVRKLGQRVEEGIQIRMQLDPGIGSVMADPVQIEQVVTDLAVNARDAMPRGGQLTFMTRNVDLEDVSAGRHDEPEPGPFVLLEVSDTGGGMDAATAERIFEPFFTTKGLGVGAGLGLSAAHGIVRQSGGSISVRSEPGRGTTFNVLLPRVVGGVDETTLPVEPRPDSFGGETILVVDDDGVLRNLVRRILEEFGYGVVEASNGHQALRMFDEPAERIDLVVTDIVMPELGGLELRDRLKSRRPDLKVLFMSGYSGDSLADGGEHIGETTVLQKPFAPTALGLAVRRLLDA